MPLQSIVASDTSFTVPAASYAAVKQSILSIERHKKTVLDVHHTRRYTNSAAGGGPGGTAAYSNYAQQGGYPAGNAYSSASFGGTGSLGGGGLVFEDEPPLLEGEGCVVGKQL